MAPAFFDDLHGWSIELYFLQTARLLDPARQGSNSNLTVEHFEKELALAGKLTDKITDCAKVLKLYKGLASDPRCKVIAHVDLAFARIPSTIGLHKQEDFEDFLSRLQAFCDLVGDAVGVGPCDFSVQSGEGDVIDFLTALKKIDPKDD